MQKSRVFLMGLFILFIFGIGGINLRNSFSIIKSNYKNDTEYRKNLNSNVEEDYRNNFTKRNMFVNGYGVIQRALGRNIIGNMEFVQEHGTMDIAHVYEYSDYFESEINNLDSILSNKQIPFLYVQMPIREDYDSTVPSEICNTKDICLRYKDDLKSMGIEMLTGEDILNGENAPDIDEFYFKTDIHPTTKGEIWTANKIAEKLGDEYGIKIDNLINDNDSRFTKLSHPFLGNLAKSVGEYYIGKDIFEEYIPKIQPDYEIENICTGEIQKGKFEDVVMNGMQKEGNSDGYYVTNYLKYGLACYNVTNKNVEGPNLMIICDSFAYRMISYLSLQCKNITVVDPRFFDYQQGNNPLLQSLELYDYDCVIYLHGTVDITNCRLLY